MDINVHQEKYFKHEILDLSNPQWEIKNSTLLLMQCSGSNLVKSTASVADYGCMFQGIFRVREFRRVLRALFSF